MTNEELLEQLKILNETMSMTLNPEESTNRYVEIRDLEDKKEIIEKEIANLKLKLTDDANYPNFNFIANKSKLSRISDRLENLNSELERNQNAIMFDTNRIQEVDSEVEACNELISQCENEINELGKELRSLGENPDPEREHECTERMTIVREELDYLRGELSLFNQERDSLAASITSLTERNQTIPSIVERYENLKLSVNESDMEKVNLSNKRLDQNRLSSLQGSLEQLDNRINYMESNVSEDISNLITEIELGVVPPTDVISRLRDVKSKFPISLLDTDYEQYEEKLEENHAKQAELAMQISDLETKLSDPVNYTPSVFAVEVMDEELADIQAAIIQREEEIKQAELDIKQAERRITRANREIAKREEKIENIQAENDEIKFRMTDASLSDIELSDLNKQFKKNKKQIERIREQIERQNKNITTQETLISTTKKDKKELENMRISESKEFQERRKTLEDSKTINRLQMLNDQNALNVLISQLTALKAEEQILNGNHLQQIDNMINNYDVKKASKTYKTKAGNEDTSNTNDDIDTTLNNNVGKNNTQVITTNEIDETLEDTLDNEPKKDGDSKDTSEPEKDEIEASGVDALMRKLESIERLFFDEDRYKQGYDFMNPENAKNIGAVVEPTVSKEEEKPKKGAVIIAKWKDASSNLIEKIKNSKFVKNLKKNLVTLGLTIAFAATVFAHMTDDKAKEPTKPNVGTEDIIDDDKINDDLDEDIKDVVGDIVDTPVEPDPIVPDTPVEPDPIVPDTPVEPDPIVPDTPVEPEPIVPDTPVEPEPIVPDTPVEPEQTPVVQEPIKEVVLQPGETLVIPETDGSYTAVDNSDMVNDNLIEGEVDYNYPESEEIGGVTVNDDNSITVELTNPIVPDTSVNTQEQNSGYVYGNFSAEELEYFENYNKEYEEMMRQQSEASKTR